MRSEIAARWAARLGYINIMRYPIGYLGWLETNCEESVEKVVASRPDIGDVFPDVRLQILEGKTDRTYLGLEPDRIDMTLDAIDSEHLVLLVFNTLCHECGQDIRLLDDFLGKDLGEDASAVRAIAIASGDGPHAARRFRHKEKINFPVFSDQDRILFKKLGRSYLPVTYLLRRQDDGSHRIMDVKIGLLASNATFFQTLRNIAAEQ